MLKVLTGNRSFSLITRIKIQLGHLKVSRTPFNLTIKVGQKMDLALKSLKLGQVLNTKKISFIREA